LDGGGRWLYLSCFSCSTRIKRVDHTLPAKVRRPPPCSSSR
jgi:hypothetical protein